MNFDNFQQQELLPNQYNYLIMEENSLTKSGMERLDKQKVIGKRWNSFTKDFLFSKIDLSLFYSN